ncbi:class I adenylate-forming enzyme family protein [Jatrophihabitans fulvus]
MSAAAPSAVSSPAWAVDHDLLRRDPFALRARVGRGADVALLTTDAVLVAAALCALDGWAASVHLVPRDAADAVLTPSLDVVRDEDVTLGNGTDGELEPTTSTRWVVYTSGTTGTPKPITHTVASLSRTINPSAASGDLVWGLLYDPNRMAGLQVLLQSLATRSALVAPDNHAPLIQRVEHLVDHAVTALSATPTLWRQILQIPRAARWPLRQITLGGEIADQPVLNGLARTYPDARIVHVFASTETGAAFSVRDGRAGFPVDYLTDPPRGIALDIRDGILHVHSPGVSAAGADGFASTGDRVEIVGDRVLFRGRQTGVVNIGGANVWPEEVESLLRGHPDVAEATVEARANAMVGNMLVASVVLRSDADPATTGKTIRSWVRKHAASNTHVPATVRVVDVIETSPAGKVKR